MRLLFLVCLLQFLVYEKQILFSSFLVCNCILHLCFSLGSSLTFFSSIPPLAASDIGMQKLRGALKVLSDTEKQLRSSKNQATWLTVALLQLSTLESSPSIEINSPCPSLEMPYLRGKDLFCFNIWAENNPNSEYTRVVNFLANPKFF